MLRFAPTLGQEFGAVLDAMKVRGIALSPARVLRHPVQVIENLLVPVVGRVGIVADELANAAAVRGIDAPNRRTSYYELRIGVVDALLLVYFVALAGVSVALGAGGAGMTAPQAPRDGAAVEFHGVAFSYADAEGNLFEPGAEGA